MAIVELPNGDELEVPDHFDEDQVDRAINDIRVDDADIYAAADEVGVDRDIFHSLIQQESSGRIFAVGDGGRAIGLGQLHEAAAKDVGLSAEDRWDPYANLLGAAGYLKQQLTAAGGDVRRGLAFYNQGAGATPEALQRGLRYADQVQLRALGGGAAATAEPAPRHPQWRDTKQAQVLGGAVGMQVRGLGF